MAEQILIHKFQGPEKPIRQWRAILSSLFGVEAGKPNFASQTGDQLGTLEAEITDDQFDAIKPLWKAFVVGHFGWREAVRFGVPANGEDARAIAYICWARKEIEKAWYNPEEPQGVEFTARIALKLVTRQPANRQQGVAEAILKRLGG